MKKNAQQIHKQRLLQLTAITEIPLIGIGLKSFLEGAIRDGVILLIVGGLLTIVFFLARRGYQRAGSFTFLIILTSMLLLFQWIGGGIKDNSILALPGVLIFAAMIGALQFFNALLALLTVNILLMGWAGSQGYEFAPPTLSMSHAINIAIILVIVGIATRVLNRDNLQLLTELAKRIEEVEDAKKVVEHQANHDHLTGLPNRLQAESKFREILSRLNRKPEESAGVIYIDFDEFKEINDSLGHNIGDQFLVAKATKLRAHLRAYDTVCRIGGDEFLVLAEDIDENQLADLANKLLSVIAEAEIIDDNRLYCTCSVGIVCLPRDAQTYEQAVQRADIAMYRSKNQGKNQFHFYDESMESSVLRHYEIQSRLLSAILRKEFYVAYQPIFDIKDNKMVGAEALARWDHPLLGTVTPNEFIPIAESSGAIEELSTYVLNQTCLLLEKILPDQPDFYISVNISPSQLQSEHFFPKVLGVLQQFNLPNSALKFEITETQIISRDPVFEANIAALHDHNIGLLLDDFGTGYSNLSHLQKMKFETIKIDRSFILDCYKDINSVTLLKSIAAMAEQLNVEIIAEGIESSQELGEIVRLGIHKGQGYLWSKAERADDFYGYFLKETVDPNGLS